MKVLNAVNDSRRRVVFLAMALTGVLAAGALAATTMTIDPTVQLSPGRLHATLTGTVTCDAGRSVFLGGQIVQSGRTSFGSTSVACSGTSQPYAIDVPAHSSGPYKAGKASAQVSTSTCEQICTSTYTDAIVRLKK